MEETKQVEIPEDLKTLYYVSKQNPGSVETTTERMMQLIERTGRAEAAQDLTKMPGLELTKLRQRCEAELDRRAKAALSSRQNTTT